MQSRRFLLGAFSHMILLLGCALREDMVTTKEEFKNYLAKELGMNESHELWGEEAHCWHREGYKLDTGKLSARQPTKLGHGLYGSTWLIKASFLATAAHHHGEQQQHEFALKVVNMSPLESHRHEEWFGHRIYNEENSCEAPKDMPLCQSRWDEIVTELMAQRAIAPDDPRFTPAYMQCYTANRVYFVIPRHRFNLEELGDLEIKLIFPELCTAAAQMAILIDGFHHVVPDKLAVHQAAFTVKNWMVDSGGDVVLIDYGEAAIYPIVVRDSNNKNIIINSFSTAEPIVLWQNGYYGLWRYKFLPSEHADWNSLTKLFDDKLVANFEVNSIPIASPQTRGLGGAEAATHDYYPTTPHSPPPERSSHHLEKLLEAPYFEQCFQSLTRDGLIDAEIKSRQEWLDELKKKPKGARKHVLAPFLRVIREIPPPNCLRK